MLHRRRGFARAGAAPVPGSATPETYGPPCSSTAGLAAVLAEGSAKAPALPGIGPSRRLGDVAYLLLVSLSFPLYWVKVMDWRLCSPEGTAAVAGGDDPWLIRPPSPAWAAAWPCAGSQAAKLLHVARSPGPLLRSMVVPVCWSELHFLSTFWTVMVGGLLMVTLIPSRTYRIANPVRLVWSVTGKGLIKAVPIVVKLLRPQSPWPLAIMTSLQAEGAASVFFVLALALPPRTHVAIALIDLAQVAVIASMYCMSGNDPWPHAALSPMALVLVQLGCTAAAVPLSAFMWSGAAAAPPARAGAADSGGADSGHPRDKGGEERDGEGPTKPAASEVAAAHAEAAAAAGIGAVPREEGEGPGQQLLERQATAGAAGGRGAALGSWSCCGGGGASKQQRAEQALQLCRELARQPHAYKSVLTLTHVYCKLPGVDPSDLPPGMADRVAEVLACLGPQLGIPVGSEYAGAAVGSSGPGYSSGSGSGLVAVDMCVRAGCVELHLDLVCGADGGVAAAAAAAAEWEAVAGPHAPHTAEHASLASCLLAALGLPAGYDKTIRAQVGMQLLTMTPAAAGAEGSDVAASLGGARAGDDGISGVCVGGGAGSWVVQGSRRIQSHEAPWVSRVEPRAVVAAAAATYGAAAAAMEGLQACFASHATSTVPGCDGQCVGATAAAAAVSATPLTAATAVRLRMTVCGTEEVLSRAHEAGSGLELLAMFEGAFLPITHLGWGTAVQEAAALDADATAAATGGSGGGGGGGAGGGAVGQLVRLPPSLTLCERELVATMALPQGRSGPVVLLLMRRGTAGRSHSLLLVRAEEEALAKEVAALARRQAAAAVAAAAAHAAGVEGWGGGGSAGGGAGSVGGGGCGWRLAAVEMGLRQTSLDRFVDDLGRWLQYRDHWRRVTSKAEAAAEADAAAEAEAKAAEAPSGPLAGGVWGALLRGAASWRGGGGEPRGQPPVPACISACAFSSTSYAPAPAPAPTPPKGAPTFHTPSYQQHMSSLRHLLVEFAVEQGCAAVTAALLQTEPLPPPQRQHQQHMRVGAANPAEATDLENEGDAVFGGAAAAACDWEQEQPESAVAGYTDTAAPPPPPPATDWLAELAAASCERSPDGLTLLHRAVRSSDAATVDALMDAVSAAAAKTVVTTATTTAAAAAACISWTTPDAFGLSPLHYAAVLEDGGALAAHVLRCYPAAAAAWAGEAGLRAGLPPPATFAQQAGMDLSSAVAEAVLATGTATAAVAGPAVEAEEAAESRGAPAKQEEETAAENGVLGLDCSSHATPRLSTRSLLAASLLRGFPCGVAEQRYQCSAAAADRDRRACRPLLALHLAACAAGLIQAFAEPHAGSRAALLPLALLHAGAFLLALRGFALRRRCGSPPPPASAAAGSTVTMGVVWVLQAVLLGALIVQTMALPFRLREIGGSGGGAGSGCGGAVGLAAAAGCSASPAFAINTCPLLVGVADDGDGLTGLETDLATCGVVAAAVAGGTSSLHLQQALLALHHVLVVVTVPYSPYTVHRLLLVQAVEVAACVALGAAAVLGSGGGGDGCVAASVVGAGAGAGPAEWRCGAGLGQGMMCRVLCAGLGMWRGGEAAGLAHGPLLRGAAAAVVALASDLRARAAFVHSTRGDDVRKRPAVQIQVQVQARTPRLQDVNGAALRS